MSSLPGLIKKTRSSSYLHSNVVCVIISCLVTTLIAVIGISYYITSMAGDQMTVPKTVITPDLNPLLEFEPANKIVLSKSIAWNKPPSVLKCHMLDSTDAPLISIIILTYKNAELLARLMDVLCALSSPWPFEIILADNGCFRETRALMQRYDMSTSGSKTDNKRIQYFPICTNEKYALANNRAAAKASPSSQWYLFLNDDIIPMTGFLNNFKSTIEAHELLGVKIGAVGCKLLFPNMRVVEAGSIIRADAGTDNFLRDGDRCDPQVRFTRQIHYSSGACVMFNVDAFHHSGGFESELYTSYFEDTHLQMKIIHKENMSIVYSPFSQAMHLEHATFGKKGSKDRIVESREKFKVYWAEQLLKHPKISAPPNAQGALSAHILSRDARSSDRAVLRVLVAMDIYSIPLLEKSLLGVTIASGQGDLPPVLLTIIITSSAQITNPGVPNSNLISIASAWSIIDRLRALGVEVIAEESDRTGPAYIPPETGPDTALSTEKLIYNNHIRKSVDGCSFSYYERNPPKLEAVLSERPEYYHVLLVAGAGQPGDRDLPAIAHYDVAGLEEVMTIDTKHVIFTSNDNRGSSAVGAVRSHWKSDTIKPHTSIYQLVTVLTTSAVTLSKPVTAGAGGGANELKQLLRQKIAQMSTTAVASLQPIEKITPPAETVGLVVLAAAWNPVLWHAVAGSVRAWCASNGIPFVCPPDSYRCKSLDTQTFGKATSLKSWGDNHGGRYPGGSLTNAVASNGYWGVVMADLPGDTLKNDGLSLTKERTTLILMPPQQECVLKLRQWHDETHRRKASSKEAVEEPTLMELIADKDITKRLCQDTSVCSSVIGETCTSQEHTNKAVEVIRSITRPEAVLLMPLSVFDSALSSLLGKIHSLTRNGVAFMKDRIQQPHPSTSGSDGTSIGMTTSPPPEARSFNVDLVRKSSMPVAEALREVDEANIAMLANGGDAKESENDPKMKAVFQAQLELEEIVRWDLTLHGTLRELAMKGELTKPHEDP